MDKSKLPKRSKRGKSLWEKLGVTDAARTVASRGRGSRPAGSYLTNKKTKKSRLDQAFKY